MSALPRCLVVGAGPSGLVAARYLRDTLAVTVADCKDEVGGLWNYTELTDETTPDSDLHKALYGHQQGSMYDNMLLNIPIEITHTEDFESHGTTSFPARPELLQYLLEYVAHFNLRPLLRLRTIVQRITSLPDQSFSVTLRSADGTETVEQFEKVVLATGHYSIPKVPKVPGVDSFPGPMWHSHNFRRVPEDKFAGKKVILIGGGSSSWDILLFIVRECPDVAQVVMSARDKRHSFLARITDPLFLDLVAAGKIKIVEEVVRFEGTKAVYATGEFDEVSEVVFCTGYQFAFPYMPEIEVYEDGEYVRDFYKGVFWLKNPNLAMVGAHRGVLFLKLDLVGKWLARDFLKPADVDSWRAQLEAEEARVLALGKPLSTIFAGIDMPEATERYFQDLGLDYDRQYAAKCARLFALTREYRKTHFFTYKTLRLGA